MDQYKKNSWYKPMCSNKTFLNLKSNSIHDIVKKGED